MEANSNEKSNTKTSKILNTKKKKVKPMSLYSSISNLNLNINYKNTNLIPLSHLLKYKLNINNKENKNANKNKKLNSLGKIPLNQYKRNKSKILSDYNSFYTQKLPLLKLPKIKCNNNNENNELKGSLFGSIYNKFEQFDNKFKEQEKVSAYMIQRGEKNLKLKKEYIKDDDAYKYCASKHNYKKQYSKLFKRIKNIQLI